jgi:histidine kinase-like protein
MLSTVAAIRTPPANIRQLTDVFHCKLQQHFRRNGHRARQLRNRIDAMTPTRPTELHQRCVRLAREPTAAAEARRQVRAVIRAWKVPVDPDIAVLLTSDLVTNAIMHGAGETVMLAIGCSRGHLRIDVYETSRWLPMAADKPARNETGRGLVLIAALSTDWGSFRTPAGEAAYFTLAFQPDVPRVGEGATAGDTRQR